MEGANEMKGRFSGRGGEGSDLGGRGSGGRRRRGGTAPAPPTAGEYGEAEDGERGDGGPADGEGGNGHGKPAVVWGPQTGVDTFLCLHTRG